MSPVEGCRVPLWWSGYLLSFTAKEAEARMLNESLEVEST